jgi:hypothetical protein
MNSFRIENTVSGLDMGIYEGETEDSAIQAMLNDANASDDPSDDLVAKLITDELPE